MGGKFEGEKTKRKILLRHFFSGLSILPPKNPCFILGFSEIILGEGFFGSRKKIFGLGGGGPKIFFGVLGCLQNFFFLKGAFFLPPKKKGGGRGPFLII